MSSSAFGGYLPWKKRPRPEDQDGVFHSFAEALYDKQQELRGVQGRGMETALGKQMRNPNLSPETLILTVNDEWDDFEFLRTCGISTKGMILGNWR